MNLDLKCLFILCPSLSLCPAFFFSPLSPQRKTRRSKLPDHNSQDPKRDAALWEKQNSLSGRNRGRWSGRSERTGGTAASALRRGTSRKGEKPSVRLKSPQERGMTGAGLDGLVLHDPSSSRNFSDTRGGADGAARLPAAAILGEPGSVDGAHQAPSSDFVPKCDIIGKDALSALHRAGSQQCRQEIANMVCQHQAGKLMPDTLPQFCPQLGENTCTDSVIIYSMIIYLSNFHPLKDFQSKHFSSPNFFLNIPWTLWWGLFSQSFCRI